MNMAVDSIVKILTISGLQSCRIFTPLFIYLLFIVAAFDNQCSCDNILKLAQMTPVWMKNHITLGVFGGLSLVEIVSIYNCDIKEFYTTFVGKYLKPVVAAVVAFGFLSNKDTELVTTLVDNSTVIETTTSAVGSLACSAATYTMDEVRTKVDEIVTAIAPDNEFKIQTIYNLIEDSWVFILLFLVIFIPLLAIILVCLAALATLLLKLYIKRQEAENSHPCSNCQSNENSTSVSNAAVICPVCKKQQETINKVNFLGIPNDKVVLPNQIKEHKVALLSKNKCPNCATSLSSKTSCSTCQTNIWEDGMLNTYTSLINKKAIKYWIIICLVAWIPYIGLIIESILVKVFIFRPYIIHNTIWQKIQGKFWGRFCKMMIAILLGWCPITGYVFAYIYYKQSKEFRDNFINNVKK